MTGPALVEAEALSAAWNDAFVRREDWKEHELADPVAWIEYFMSRMHGSKLLDAGCGWGRYARRFLRPGIVYTGIDHSIEAIRLARKTHPDMHFEVGSIARMPYEAEHFDGIWSCCALGSIPKAHLHAVLSEHTRVLRPQGMAMFLIPFPFNGVSEEGMFEKEDGSPSIWRAHYEIDEFCDYLMCAGLTVIHADYDLSSGSQFALAQRC